MLGITDDKRELKCLDLLEQSLVEAWKSLRGWLHAAAEGEGFSLCLYQRLHTRRLWLRNSHVTLHSTALLERNRGG